MFGDLEKNRSVKYIGDLKKRGRRFGETWSAQLRRLRIGVHHEVAYSSATTSGC